MIPIVFNGNPAYLLDDVPNWVSAVTITATLPASYERSLTGKETRRQTGDTLRLEAKWTALVDGAAEVTSLRNSLQALNVQPVLCPFWPGGFAAGTLPVITSAWYILLDGVLAPSLQPASALGAGFARFAYPVMIGRLVEIPDPTMLSPNMCQADFHFAEDNAAALTPPAFAPPAGIAAASGVRPLFPFRPDWDTNPTSLGADVDISLQQIGQTRPLATVFYTQPGRRRLEQSFTLLNTDPLNLLSFFAGIGGENNSFWLPATVMEASLTANVAATDTAVQVDNGAALGTNTFIALESGATRLPLAVSSVAGNQWNFAAAVGTAFVAGITQVDSLVLARFDVLKVELSFTSPTLATARLKFRELPWEMAAAAGETIGTTMGALPTTATLYVFTLTIPAANVVTYFTSFERNLSDGTNTYLSVQMENGDINEAATLERQNVSLKARNFAGNPLALLVPFQLEWPLEVAIYEADVVGNVVSNLRCYFSGEVSDVSLEGPIITANCASLNWMFERTAARRLYQQNDNWILFEAANGLLPANWQWNAKVASSGGLPAYDPVNVTLTVDTITSTNAATLAAHFFAAGYLYVTHAGVAQYRMISDSTVLAGGQIILHLTSPFTMALSVGDVVVLYPGYDGQAETAINTFNNYGNFGGFPFIPTGNPFVLRIPTNAGSGKK